METAGINETAQIVMVTDHGVEKFFLVSGKGLKASGMIAKEMVKLMAIMAKNIRKGLCHKGEISLEDTMNVASLTGDTVHAISMDKEDVNKFITYANNNQVQYSVVDTGKADTELIAYTGSNDKVIEQYVHSNREKVAYTSIWEESRQSTLDQINVNDNSYVRLYKDNIVATDRNLRYVRVKMGSQDNPIYADMPAENIKIDSDKNYYISVRENDIFTCYTIRGTQKLNGVLMTNTMKEYQHREEEALRYSLKQLSSCPAKQKMEYMSNPLQYKKTINSIRMKEQYGDSKRVVSFFYGSNRKTMYVSDKSSSGINTAKKLKKTALQKNKR